jgi:hypothetical protein
MAVSSQEENISQKSKELTYNGPDLNLIVQMVPSDKGFTLQFRLHSSRGFNRYNFKKFGELTLLGNPQDKVQEIYSELSQMAKYDFPQGDQSAAEERLCSIGMDLWTEIIPKELKEEYWKFCSHTRSLQVTSDEPWIPWEIIKPHNNTKEEPFWCQKFAMSRWLSESANIEILPLGIALPVAPLNTDLPHLNDEIEFLENLNELHEGVKCEKTLHKYLDVKRGLKNENISIMHFACHGEFNQKLPSNSPINLSDQPLKPSDINISFEEKLRRPLIFINACHTGRTGFSLTWLGGWPVRFVGVAKVGAFIGTMWEVDDQLAVQFAKSFYIALLRDKKPISEAFRDARKDIRNAKPCNSSWLGYVLYADPDAMMLDP